MVKGVIKRVIRSYLPVALAAITSVNALAQGVNYGKNSSGEKPPIQVYDITEMPFNSQTNKINVSGLERRLCDEGVDGEVLEGEALDNANTNYRGFKEKIFADALKEGYTTNQIARFTPKEAVELSTILAAKNLNYIGKTERWDDTYSQLREKLKTTKDPVEKEQLTALLADVGESLPMIKFGETIAIDNASNGRGYDKKSIQQRYTSGEEVVCQGFSRANVQIFNVLKSLNPSLANTYLSGFVCPEQKHMWNQVTNVQRDNNGKISYALGFVEPQTKDRKNINAIDTQIHLDKQGYNNYINKFYNKSK